MTIKELEEKLSKYPKSTQVYNLLMGEFVELEVHEFTMNGPFSSDEEINASFTICSEDFGNVNAIPKENELFISL